MCNPRKVMIHLARCIEGAWRRTVEQAATESGEVNELGRIDAEIPLDEEMGPVALEMLGQTLAEGFEGFDPWDRDSLGYYRRDLGDVALVFNPETGRLNVEARLTELISAEARAAVEASGFTVGDVAVEAMAQYYDDEWGGRTKEKAEAEAQAKAEHRLQEAINELHRDQNPEAFVQAEDEAQKQAREAARQNLEIKQIEVRKAMRRRIQSILTGAEEQVNHVMNHAVGEAYHRTLHHLVRENGGKVLMDEQTGSIINMEMEL